MITWLGLFVLVRGKGWDRCLSETRYKRLISGRGCCCSGGGGEVGDRRRGGGRDRRRGGVGDGRISTEGIK